jgi:hypothetical protein
MDCLIEGKVVLYEQDGMALTDRVRSLEIAFKRQTEALDGLQDSFQSQRQPEPIKPLLATKPDGFWAWAPRIPWIISPIALVVAIISFFWPRYSAHAEKDLNSTLDGRIEAKLSEPKQTLTDIRIDVAKLGTKVDDFGKRLDDIVVLMKPVALRQLKDIVALPRDQFPSALQSVASALYVANHTDTQVETAVIDQIRSRITSIPDSTSGYWPAVGGLITQRLAIRNGVRLENALGAASCWPQGSAIKIRGLEVACPNGSVLDIDNSTIADSVIENLIIRYRGTGPVEIRGVTFINCSFLIVLSGPPPASGRHLAMTVLTTTGHKVTL